MHFQLETGIMYVSSALAEKNQQQSNKFWKPYKVSITQEIATGYKPSPPEETRKSSGPVFNKIDAYEIKSYTYRKFVTN